MSSARGAQNLTVYKYIRDLLNGCHYLCSVNIVRFDVCDVLLAIQVWIDEGVSRLFIYFEKYLFPLFISKRGQPQAIPPAVRVKKITNQPAMFDF